MSQEFLKPYKWENRVIILVASEPDHPMLPRQLRIFEERSPGIKERDLVIFSNQADSLDNSIRQAIRNNFDLPDEGFRFLLIGKDGSVKIDRAEVVSSKELFAIIDAMPMRRREMKDQKR